MGSFVAALLLGALQALREPLGLGRPFGEGVGPNAVRVLLAAIGSCLAVSLVFCLRKSRGSVTERPATVEGSAIRNARGRLCLGGVRVRLDPVVAPDDHGRFTRCLAPYEDFCLVTQSAREGIDCRRDRRPTGGRAAASRGPLRGLPG